MRLVPIGFAYGEEKHALQDRFGQQLCHVFWARVAEIGDLMAATCARGDNLCPRRLTVDRIEQALPDLHREIVLLCERAERASHSATRCIENLRFPARQAVRQVTHEG